MPQDHITLIDEVVTRYTEFASFSDICEYYRQNPNQELALDIRGYDMNDRDFIDLVNFETCFAVLMNEFKTNVEISITCTLYQFNQLKDYEIKLKQAA